MIITWTIPFAGFTSVTADMPFVIPHFAFTSNFSSIFAQVSQRVFKILIFDHECSIVVSLCIGSILLKLRISSILVLSNVTEFNRFCELVSARRFAFEFFALHEHRISNVVVRTKTTNYYVLVFSIFFFIAKLLFLQFTLILLHVFQSLLLCATESQCYGQQKKKSRSEAKNPP